MFYVPQAILNEIIEHAREGKPQEVCGILSGRDGRAFELIRGRNVAANPITDYEIDAQTLLRQFDLEQDGDEMVGIYHSHPVSPAYPSASDAWSAYYPDCAYLICSLENDARPVVRAFRLLPQDVSLEAERVRAQLGMDETRPGRYGYYQAVDAPLPPVLQAAGKQVPRPFYVVFESGPEQGMNSSVRVVSVLEETILVLFD